MRAAIVVTGSELVRGDRTDLNGPFLARSLLTLGIEPAEVRIVGDDPAELARALAGGLERDLLVVSGGLGPTHDDRTVELLAHAAGVPLRLDADLERQIEQISRRAAARSGRPYPDFAPGVAKQATIPDGAIVVGLAGTAPALLLARGDRVVVALPGPPAELQALWPAAVELEPFARLRTRALPRARRVLRFYGVGESSVAQAFELAGGEPDGVEVTICARDSEIHVDLLVAPGAEPAADALEHALAEPLADSLFARDDRSIAQLIVERSTAAELRLATAESCTGGLVAGALTAVPGASAAVVGAVVAYADAVKRDELGVRPETLAAFGAVSPETAREMALGVRERLGADAAVSVTGIAGPGGGSADKPVGLVNVCAVGPAGEFAAELRISGDRGTVRRRATVAALHLLYRAVSPPG